MCCLSVFCCTSKNRASDATASTGADEEEEEDAEEEESDMFGCVWFVFDFNRLHVQEKKQQTNKQKENERMRE